MRCKRANDWMSASLDGELGFYRQKKLTRHLKGCKDCRQAMERLRELSRRLDAAYDGASSAAESERDVAAKARLEVEAEPALPPELWGRVRAEMRARMRDGQMAPSGQGWPFLARVASAVVAGAVGLACGALLYFDAFEGMAARKTGPRAARRAGSAVGAKTGPAAAGKTGSDPERMLVADAFGMDSGGPLGPVTRELWGCRDRNGGVR